MALGKTIIRLRMQKGLSQAELASRLEIHASQLNRWEKNLSQPRASSLERLAVALEVTVDELMAGDLQRVTSAFSQLDDPELAELFRNSYKLAQDERAALKVFLKAMLTRVQMAEMIGRAS